MDDTTSDEDQDATARSNGYSTSPAAEAIGLGPANFSGPIYSLRLKILVLVVVAASAAAVGLLYLWTSDDDGTSPSPSGSERGSTTHQGVQRLYPAENAQVLQQQAVGVDLVPGWDGTLTVNDQLVPEEDLTRSSPRQTGDNLELAPGPDKVLSGLPTGSVCARVELWPRSRGPEEGSTTVEWCFTVI